MLQTPATAARHGRAARHRLTCGGTRASRPGSTIPAPCPPYPGSPATAVLSLGGGPGPGGGRSFGWVKMGIKKIFGQLPSTSCAQFPRFRLVWGFFGSTVFTPKAGLQWRVARSGCEARCGARGGDARSRWGAGGGQPARPEASSTLPRSQASAFQIARVPFLSPRTPAGSRIALSGGASPNAGKAVSARRGRCRCCLAGGLRVRARGRLHKRGRLLPSLS